MDAGQSGSGHVVPQAGRQSSQPNAQATVPSQPGPSSWQNQSGIASSNNGTAASSPSMGLQGSSNGMMQTSPPTASGSSQPRIKLRAVGPATPGPNTGTGTPPKGHAYTTSRGRTVRKAPIPTSAAQAANGRLRQSARQANRVSARAEQASRVKKLKLSFKGLGGSEASGGRKISFLGEYDRELDENPEEPLAFEEQFILRVPNNVADGPNGLREMVKGKGKGLDGVEFKFLDSRRAVFKINGVSYSSKLVDLPCIIESQKTFDHRHLFKVADISQMLVVDRPIKDESTITSAPLKIDEYVWPHGITPPLRHVRKRRFRKRISRRAIEVVEEQVEDLLKKDSDADTTSFDLIDAHPDPEIPDSYYVDYDPEAMWHQGDVGSEYGGSEMYEDPGSVAASNMDEWGEGDYGTDLGDGMTPGGTEFDDDGTEGDGGFEDDLEAALLEQMEGGGDGSGDSDEDGLSASEDEDDDEEDAEKSGDEDDEESAAKKARIRQLTSEIKALETAIEKKRSGFAGGNPIIQKRFDEMIAGLQADVKTKVDTRQVIIDELDQAVAEKKEAENAHREAVEGSRDARDSADVDMDADGEGEEGDISTPAAGLDKSTPNTPATPGQGEVSRRQAQNADADGEEDDLFGDDDDDDEEGTGVATGDEGEMSPDDEGASPAVAASGMTPTNDELGELGMFDGGAGDDNNEEDEMAAMLKAELGDNTGDQNADNQMDIDLPPNSQDGPGQSLQNQMEADAALDSLAAFGMDEQGVGVGNIPMSSPSRQGAELDDLGGEGLDQDALNSAAFSFGGVEGGAGMRRLASGMVADDDDDSSDDSDD